MAKRLIRQAATLREFEQWAESRNLVHVAAETATEVRKLDVQIERLLGDAASNGWSDSAAQGAPAQA
jgi:hypothetical protein